MCREVELLLFDNVDEDRMLLRLSALGATLDGAKLTLLCDVRVAPSPALLRVSVSHDVVSSATPAVVIPSDVARGGDERVFAYAIALQRCCRLPAG